MERPRSTDAALKSLPLLLLLAGCAPVQSPFESEFGTLTGTHAFLVKGGAASLSDGRAVFSFFDVPFACGDDRPRGEHTGIAMIETSGFKRGRFHVTHADAPLTGEAKMFVIDRRDAAHPFGPADTIDGDLDVMAIDEGAVSIRLWSKLDDGTKLFGELRLPRCAR